MEAWGGTHTSDYISSSYGRFVLRLLAKKAESCMCWCTIGRKKNDNWLLESGLTHTRTEGKKVRKQRNESRPGHIDQQTKAHSSRTISIQIWILMSIHLVITLTIERAHITISSVFHSVRFCSYFHDSRNSKIARLLSSTCVRIVYKSFTSSSAQMPFLLTFTFTMELKNCLDTE